MPTIDIKTNRSRLNTSPGPGSYHLDTMFNVIVNKFREKGELQL